MTAGARRGAARALRLAARLVEAPRTTVHELRERGRSPGTGPVQEHELGTTAVRHVAVPLDAARPPRIASDLDGERVELVVTVDSEDLEHRPEVLVALAAEARATGLPTSAVVYEAEEAVGRTHAPPVLPDGLPLVVDHVVRGWSAGLASTYPSLSGDRVVVVDSSVAIGALAVHELVRAVSGDVLLAQAVLRRSDETVASAGALFVGPLAAPAPLLAGFPSEDAEQLGVVEVTAADAPAFAVRTSALTVPPPTADVPLAVAALSLATRAGRPGRVVAVPLGRVHQLRAPVRRSDVAAQDLLQTWTGEADPAGRAVLASLGLVLEQGQAATVPDDGRVPLRVAQPLLRRRRPVVEEAAPRLRWSVTTAAWAGERGDDWGDVFFAHDLARALRDLGQDVVLDNRQSAVRPASEHPDDVSLVLRGLDRVALSPHAVNLLWVISHPDLVGDLELSGYDRAWSAGRVWAENTSARTGLRIDTLLQATDPRRFSPGPVDEELRSDVLFVGKTRGVFRPVVRDALAAGLDLAVWGSGWEHFLGAEHLRGEFLANDRLPAAYRSARIVLNDHWADMAREGFVSNRVFDALASGAVVVSDEVAGLTASLGSAVRTYRDADDLRRLGAELRGVDEVERRETAGRIAQEHSFARRAEVLLASAVPLVRARRGAADRG